MEEIKQNMAEWGKKESEKREWEQNLRVVIYHIPGRGADGVSLLFDKVRVTNDNGDPYTRGIEQDSWENVHKQDGGAVMSQR